jgi:hypothetical protein
MDPVNALRAEFVARNAKLLLDGGAPDGLGGEAAGHLEVLHAPALPGATRLLQWQKGGPRHS